MDTTDDGMRIEHQRLRDALHRAMERVDAWVDANYDRPVTEIDWSEYRRLERDRSRAWDAFLGRDRLTDLSTR